MPQTLAAHATSGKSRQSKQRNPAVPLSKNDHLLRWVEKMAELTKPAAIHWVDGSPEENDAICAEMVAGGTFIKQN
jgi:phosphoenolpyruvate carboxykinase (GTP)